MGIIFKQSFKNTLVIYLGFLIGGINTVVLYTRFLEEEYYGLVTFVLASSNLIMPLTAFGIHYTIVKFFSSYTSKQERDRFLSFALLPPLVFSLLIGYFWNYLQTWILHSVSDENSIVENYTIYIYVVAVCCAYFEIFYAWAKVQMQSVFGNLLKELYNRVAIMLLLFAVYFDIISKEDFIVYLTCSYALRTLLMMVYALQLYFPKFQLQLPENYKEILKYSFFIILAGSAGAIIIDIDKIMIAGKDTFDKAAYYTVAVFIGTFIDAPSRAMSQILQPITSKSINEDNIFEVQSLYQKSSINLLLIGGLFFILINCNVTELFKIMPKQYWGGEWVVLLISGAKLFNMSLGNNGAIISNSKFYRITLFTGVGMALMVYFLNKYFYFNLDFGTEGLALSTFLTFIIFGCFKLWYVSKKLHMFPYTKKTLVISSVILFSYVVFQFWNFDIGTVVLFNFPIHPIINIILKSCILIPIYILIVYRFSISEQINSIIDTWLTKKGLR